LRRLGVAGHALVAIVIDSLGHVEPQSIQIFETPDTGLGDEARALSAVGGELRCAPRCSAASRSPGPTGCEIEAQIDVMATA